MTAAAIAPAPWTGQEITDLCVSVFQNNVVAGWWTDIETGESLVGKRNVGEMLMLIVTELSEGADGLLDNLMDDKLPHRQMIEVELADTVIRIAELGGGVLGSEAMGSAFDATRGEPIVVTYRGCDSPNDYLLRIIGRVSAAMEHHRKGRPTSSAWSLAMALHGVFILGEILELDVRGAIVEKREFNRTRPDHQVENRRKAGGKVC